MTTPTVSTPADTAWATITRQFSGISVDLAAEALGAIGLFQPWVDTFARGAQVLNGVTRTAATDSLIKAAANWNGSFGLPQMALDIVLINLNGTVRALIAGSVANWGGPGMGDDAALDAGKLLAFGNTRFLYISGAVTAAERATLAPDLSASFAASLASLAADGEPLAAGIFVTATATLAAAAASPAAGARAARPAASVAATARLRGNAISGETLVDLSFSGFTPGTLASTLQALAPAFIPDLPAAVDDANVELAGMEWRYDRYTGRTIGSRARLTASRSLAIGPVSVSEFELSLGYLAGSGAFIQLGARADCGGLQIDAEIEFPKRTIRLLPVSGNKYALATLARQFVPGLPGIDQITAATVNDLDIRLDTASSAYAGTLLLSSWQVPLGNGTLTMDSLMLAFSLQAGIVDATLSAMTSFAGMRLAINASYCNGGWQFRGAAVSSSGMPVGQLAAQLAAQFDGVRLPAAVAGMTVDAFVLEFHTATRNATITIDLAFPLTGEADMAGSLRLVLDITSLTGGQWAKSFKGILYIGEYAFNVYFGSDPSATMLVCMFGGAATEPFSLRKFVQSLAQIDSSTVPESLDVSLTDAMLVVYRGVPAAGGALVTKILLTTTFEGAFNLADLPVVGTRLPAGSGMRLQFQPVIATKPFTVNELKAINRALPPGAGAFETDAELPANLQVFTNLFVGNRALSVPLALNMTAAAAPATASGAGTGGPTPPPAAPARSGVTTVRATNQPNLAWFDIQKTLGPVVINRVGIGLASNTVSLWLGAAMTSGGMTLALEGLSVSIPLDRSRPSFNLLGIGLDYKSPTVEIGGALLRTPGTAATATAPATPDSYDGFAVLKSGELTLRAIASYSTVAGEASLFGFALVDKVLGGPPCFTVTGLAGTFGFNRKLVLPGIGGIATYPLVQLAVTKANNPALPQPRLTDVLSQLRPSIPMALGEKFFGIGVKFNSFKLIDSFALVTLSLGKETRIDVVGLSVAKVPPTAGAIPPVVNVEMELRGSLLPARGELAINGQLTPASYLFAPACRLSGGFAFYSWFKSVTDAAGNRISAGDFVLTMGGYNPAYMKPRHYPAVPRLGFNWQVTRQLNVKGECYFALTPAQVMAGGTLEAQWRDGDVRAWFRTRADFLVAWKPFHYEASMSIDVGASVVIHMFGRHTIDIDAGADLSMWGPEFSGRAVVRVKVIKFTISFGQDPASPPYLDWPGFCAAFLPPPSAQTGVTVTGGLVQPGAGASLGLINPAQLQIAYNSAIPLKTITATGASVAIPAGTRTDIGIAPMGYFDRPIPGLVDWIAVPSVGESALSIEVFYGGTQVNAQFTFTPTVKAMPAALWGAPGASGLGDQALYPMLAGVSIKPAAAAATGASCTVTEADLSATAGVVNQAFAWQAGQTFTPMPSAYLPTGATPRTFIASRLMQPSVAAARAELLRGLGITPQFAIGDTNTIAASFLKAPELGSYA
ncbi:MAG: hypothetical protein JSS36_08065 [Proteobacteria bacterium]|nr:hypothetical protein [Pseudomonadota bacterium]